MDKVSLERSRRTWLSFWGREIRMLGPEVGGELFTVHLFVPLTIWMVSIIHPKILEFKIKIKSFNKERKITLFYSTPFKFYAYKFPSNTGYKHCPWSKQRPREQVTCPRPLGGFAKVLVTTYNSLYNWDDTRQDPWNFLCCLLPSMSVHLLLFLTGAEVCSSTIARTANCHALEMACHWSEGRIDTWLCSRQRERNQ